MNFQLTHENSINTSKKFPITLVCDGISSPANIGGIFRLCDAFGVSEIIFCNAEINFNSARLKKVARNTLKNTPFRVSEDILQTINQYQENDYTVYGLEISSKSIPLKSVQVKKEAKIVLIIGNEQDGISEAILNKTQQDIHIPMYGNNSSMNVVTATAIALYCLSLNSF